MAKKPETHIVKKTQELLEATFLQIWFFKVHGGMYQRAGVPDLVGCVQGLFFGLEGKRPETENDVDPLQARTILEIERAKGIAGVFTSPDQAVELLRQGLWLKGMESRERSPAGISARLKKQRSRKTRLLSSWRQEQARRWSRSE